jgi:alpha-tubulin suppressor-like RCC1 family protein
LLAWGLNSYNQLGHPWFLSYQSSIPVRVHNSVTDYDYLTNNIVLIAAGFDHSCAVTNTSKVLCWGSNLNNFGQVGSSPNIQSGYNILTFQNSNYVFKSSVTGFPTNINITQITAGDYFSCILTNNSEIYCWGRADNGRLGNGAQNGVSNTPVRVNGLSAVPITKIWTGSTHSLALAKNGSVYGWGANNNNQLGSACPLSGCLSAQFIMNNVTDISGGQNFTFLLLANGSTFSAGANSYSQLARVSSSGFAATSIPAFTGSRRLIFPSSSKAAFHFGFLSIVRCYTCFGTLGNMSSVCSGHGTCDGNDLCNCAIGWGGSNCLYFNHLLI